MRAYHVPFDRAIFLHLKLANMTQGESDVTLRPLASTTKNIIFSYYSFQYMNKIDQGSCVGHDKVVPKKIKIMNIFFFFWCIVGSLSCLSGGY
jgi:hypothetical protein